MKLSTKKVSLLGLGIALFVVLTMCLQVPIFEGGELVYEDPSLAQKQAYCSDEFATLYPEVTRINMPHEYYVDLTDKLRELKNDLIGLYRGSTSGEKVVVKVKK